MPFAAWWRSSPRPGPRAPCRPTRSDAVHPSSSSGRGGSPRRARRSLAPIGPRPRCGPPLTSRRRPHSLPRGSAALGGAAGSPRLRPCRPAARRWRPGRATRRARACREAPCAGRAACSGAPAAGWVGALRDWPSTRGARAALLPARRRRSRPSGRAAAPLARAVGSQGAVNALPAVFLRCHATLPCSRLACQHHGDDPRPPPRAHARAPPPDHGGPSNGLRQRLTRAPGTRPSSSPGEERRVFVLHFRDRDAAAGGRQSRVAARAAAASRPSWGSAPVRIGRRMAEDGVDPLLGSSESACSSRSTSACTWSHGTPGHFAQVGFEQAVASQQHNALLARLRRHDPGRAMGHEPLVLSFFIMLVTEAGATASHCAGDRARPGRPRWAR